MSDKLTKAEIRRPAPRSTRDYAAAVSKLSGEVWAEELDTAEKRIGYVSGQRQINRNKYDPFSKDPAGYNKRQSDRYIFFRLQGIVRAHYEELAVPSFPIKRKVRVGVDDNLLRGHKGIALSKYPGVPGRPKGTIYSQGELKFREDHEYEIGAVEVAYFMAVYPQLIKEVEFSGSKFSLVFYTTAESREILNNPELGMKVKTVTTVDGQPSLPSTETKATKPSDKEDKQTSDDVDEILNDEAQRKNDEKITAAGNNHHERTGNTNLLATYWKEEFNSTARWNYGLSYNEPNLPSSIGKMGRATSRFFDRAYAELPQGESGQDKTVEFDITYLAIKHKFYDTQTDPEKTKFLYTYQFTSSPEGPQHPGTFPVIRKKDKLVSSQEATTTFASNISQDADVTDWKNNIAEGISLYYNTPEQKYYAVARSSEINLSETFTNENWEPRLFESILKEFKLPRLSDDKIQALSKEQYEYLTHLDPRPNTGVSVMLRAAKSIFENGDSLAETNSASETKLTEMDLVEAQLASASLAVRKYAATINSIDKDISKGTDVLTNYDKIITKLGVNPEDLNGLELDKEIKRYSDFPNRVRRMLKRNDVDISSIDINKDVIEFVFDEEFNPLHFFVKGEMYFDGIGRDPVVVEGEPVLTPEGNVFVGYTQTTWGYIFFTPIGAEEGSTEKRGILSNADKMGTDAAIPPANFLGNYTFPPISIDPSKFKTPTDPRKSSGTNNDSTSGAREKTPEDKKKKAQERKKQSNTVDNGIISCQNKIGEIKDLRTLYSDVLNKITFSALVRALIKKTKEDLQKELALHAASAGRELDGYKRQFEQLLKDQVDCALDAAEDEINAALADAQDNLEDLAEDLTEDMLASIGIEATITFDFPKITVDGILGFLKIIAEKAIEQIITEILLGVIKEAIRAFLNCPGSNSRGPFEKYGASLLSDLPSLDVKKSLGTLSDKTGLSDTEAFQSASKVMSSITNEELVGLLVGETADKINELLENVLPGQGDNLRKLFEEIGRSMSDADLDEFRTQGRILALCDEDDYLASALKDKEALNEKGLDDEAIAKQASNAIDDLMNKLNAVCDMLEGQSPQDKVNAAINSIKMPAEATSVTNEIQRAIIRGHQQLADNSLEDFIYGRKRDAGITQEKLDTDTTGNYRLIGEVYDPTRDLADTDSDKLLPINGLALPLSGGQYTTSPTESLEASWNNSYFTIGDLSFRVEDGEMKVQRQEKEVFSLNVDAELEEDYSDIQDVINLYLPNITPKSIKDRFEPVMTLNRPPTKLEIERGGFSANPPYMNGTVYDRGSGLDFLNGVMNPFFKSFDFKTEPEQEAFDDKGLYQGFPKGERQEYAETTMFSLQNAVDGVLGEAEEMTIAESAEKMAKVSEQFAASMGLACRVFPFLLTYYSFSDNEETLWFGEEDILQRKILTEYVLSYVKKQLIAQKQLKAYSNAFAAGEMTGEQGMRLAISKILDPLFILEGETLPETDFIHLRIQYLIDRRDSAQLVFPKTVTEIERFFEDYNRQHVYKRDQYREEDDYEGVDEDNLYNLGARENAIQLAESGYDPRLVTKLTPPWKILSALYPIYLHSSTNIPRKIGGGFNDVIKSAERLLYKAQHPKEFTLKE
jgi:hypothetical protein